MRVIAVNQNDFGFLTVKIILFLFMLTILLPNASFALEKIDEPAKEFVFCTAAHYFLKTGKGYDFSLKAYDIVVKNHPEINLKRAGIVIGLYIANFTKVLQTKQDGNKLANYLITNKCKY